MLQNKTGSIAARETASALLSIGAVKLQPQAPFTWASGWKSPIYCDNRLTLSYPDIRNNIKSGLIKLIEENFSNAEAIAGVATAGIPQAALLADQLSLPMIYVRPKPKDHGMANLIEGKVEPGQKVVVVEDLISTGGSSLKAVEALKAAGFEVLGMVAIFTYGFGEAQVNFSNAGVHLFTLSDYPTLVQVGLEQGYIRQDQLTSLEAWRNDPSIWGK